MQIYAEHALLADGWMEQVVLTIDAGSVTAIETGKAPHGAECVSIVVPGVSNLHSHAFQRAFAGLTEKRESNDDSFWTWRKVMYEFLSGIGPDEANTIARALYVEMLKAGFTGVGEFHYVHHAPDGRPYDNLGAMSQATIDAAREVGIRITHLPVFYAHGGFGGAPPTEGQRRFINPTDRFLTLLEELRRQYRGDPTVSFGIAPHSLRAVTGEELRRLLSHLDSGAVRTPVHLHIAEQTAEVQACLDWSGQRPVAWLYDHFEPDQNWCLIHATHVDSDELALLARSSVVVGLCPTTEANLGDGLFPAREFLAGGGRFGIGSDSNVSVSVIEELRLLEYGQRLIHRKRALLAAMGGSVGENLWCEATRGGAQALGHLTGGLSPGACADVVVLDANHPSLIAKGVDSLLDGVVFDGNQNPVTDVMVNGRWVVRHSCHPLQQETRRKFAAVQKALLEG